MLFPTVTFAVFFTVVFGTAWQLRKRLRLRKFFLLAASYLFYGWWDWRFCFLLMGASLVAWYAGVRLTRLERDDGKAEGRREADRKFVVGTAVALLLTILAFFKYYGFFLSSLQDLLFAVGWQRDLPFLQIVLPVGISFFTFQAISYVVDVYRGHVRARRHPLDVLLYISLFPQLVAGPIVRAADFLPQLDRQPELTKSMVCGGLTLCVFGLFKKMVIAGYLASDLVDPVFLDPGSMSSAVLLLGVYGYAVQIYCDFSGYSDIAIGTALLLGFRFRRNFNQPYRALTLQDFWRRWHMSLSQWLRDYLYIPLGGSRLGSWKTYRNLFLTMFLGGLWHGAAWNFVIWGTLHGLWLALERALGVDRGVGKHGSAGSVTPVLKAFAGWLVTFHVVCAAWIFFRSSDLDAAITFFAGLGKFSGEMVEVPVYAAILVALSLASQFIWSDTTERITAVLSQRRFAVTGLLFVMSMLVILWLAPPGTAPFIYFQF